MKLLDIIANRRSIRKFTDQKISREDLEVIMEAARQAPSACNSQPCNYVVFDDETAKHAFCKEVFSGIYSNTAWAEKAPVIIAIVSNKGNISSRIGNMIKQTLFWVMDAGIAGEHIMLQAQSMGIGGCWVGWFDFKKASKFLLTGSGEKVEILIALGYPGEAPAPRPRKDFKEIVSFNKYK